jgi:hypothetical protein
MNTQFLEESGFLVMVVDATPSRAVQKRIDECIRLNVCLCGCGVSMWKRGLAQLCYGRFMAALAKVPTARKRQIKEAEAIRDGEILKSRQGQRTRSQNPYFRKLGVA